MSNVSREEQRRYVTYVPRIMRRGHGKLCHNSAPHTADMPPGVNGFQAWFEVKPPKMFKLCGCGWSRLPHFSTSPDYKCESLEALEARDQGDG